MSAMYVLRVRFPFISEFSVPCLGFDIAGMESDFEIMMMGGRFAAHLDEDRCSALVFRDEEATCVRFGPLSVWFD